MTPDPWMKLARFYPWIRNNPVSYAFLKKEIAAGSILLSAISGKQFAIVADLGSGSGHSLSLLPETAQKKIAIDRCSEMVTRYSSRFNDIIFMQADVCHLPLKSDSLDFILCVGLLEYISDAPALFLQLHRILKEGRMLLLTNAPPHFLNRMRRLSGPPLCLRHAEEVERLIISHHFYIKGKSETTLQQQYLLQKQ